jgi:hypothetical protein
MAEDKPSVIQPSTTALVDQANKNIDNMTNLATKAENDISIADSISDNTVDNMKLYLLAYARSNLQRIIFLTDKLNKMEDKLIERTMEDEYIDLSQLMSVINLIHKSVDRSVDLIKQVTNDESYLNIVINNAKIINNTIDNRISSVSDNYPILNDKSSRERVLQATTLILSQLSNIPEVNTNETIQQNITPGSD